MVHYTTRFLLLNILDEILNFSNDFSSILRFTKLAGFMS